MDASRDDSAARHPSATGENAVAAAPVSGAPRSRRARPATATTGWLREPGLVLVAGSFALGVGGVLALVLGWGALLFVVALLQVLSARAWADYLELPGAVPAAIGVLAVAAVADLGVLVSRLVGDAEDRSAELVPLAPALGVTFLVAVVVQLLRRDGREGTLAGLVAVVTGGALVIGLALWLPLEASSAGPEWVAIGFVTSAVIGVVVGGAAWVRQARVPGPALVLPVLLALLAGAFYVVGRIVAG